MRVRVHVFSIIITSIQVQYFNEYLPKMPPGGCCSSRQLIQARAWRWWGMSCTVRRGGSPASTSLFGILSSCLATQQAHCSCALHHTLAARNTSYTCTVHKISSGIHSSWAGLKAKYVLYPGWQVQVKAESKQAWHHCWHSLLLVQSFDGLSGHRANFSQPRMRHTPAVQRLCLWIRWNTTYMYIWTPNN